jgi:hypothetical protein
MAFCVKINELVNGAFCSAFRALGAARYLARADDQSTNVEAGNYRDDFYLRITHFLSASEAIRQPAKRSLKKIRFHLFACSGWFDNFRFSDGARSTVKNIPKSFFLRLHLSAVGGF